MNSANRGGKQDGDTTYCDFVVGQHVVCIAHDDTPPGLTLLDPIILPEVGRVYTVRYVSIGIIKHEVCLKLEEIPEQHLNFIWRGEQYSGDIMFSAASFRPLPKLKVEDFMSAPVDGERVSA